MKHTLFLFDLDDTLLDFKASEHLSFARTLGALGFTGPLDGLFAQYQVFNTALWSRFEAGTVSKDFLKVERFRQTFGAGGLDMDPEAASRLFVESLADTVVLVDGATQLCEALAGVGELCRARAAGSARILGVHLEGPFINEIKRGIHESGQIRHLDAASHAGEFRQQPHQRAQRDRLARAALAQDG